MTSTSRALLAVSLFGRPGDHEEKGRWKGLMSALQKAGVELWNSDSKSNPTHYLSVDFTHSGFSQWGKSVAKRNRWLICVEPETVNPLQYSDKVQKNFARVFVSSKLSPRAQQCSIWQNGHLSKTGHGFVQATAVKEKKITIINQNKFSFTSRSLYSLRTRFIKFSLAKGLEIAVAGKDWLRGNLWTCMKQLHALVIAIRAGAQPNLGKACVAFTRYPKNTFFGSVPDAIDFLRRYKVTVVIENEATYVSEKVFQALLAGTKCVYVGPPWVTPNDFPDGFLFPADPCVEDIYKSSLAALSCDIPLESETIMSWLDRSSFSADWQVSERVALMASEIARWVRAA